MNFLATFHTCNLTACLFLERSLEKDGIKTKKDSRLNTVNPSKTVGREKFIHTHMLHVECSPEILNTYVQYSADNFPKAFLNFSITSFSVTI